MTGPGRRGYTVRRMVKAAVEDLFEIPRAWGGSRGTPSVRFVVFAQGRTGSTLLQTLLDSNPDITCDGEILSVPRIAPMAKIRRRARMCRTRAYGFKLKYWHASVTQRGMSVEGLLRTLHGSGWRFLHLRRRDYLRHALSLHVSVESRLFNTGNAGHRPVGTRVDPERLLELARIKVREETVETEYLSSYEHLAIVYEDDLENADRWQETGDRIARHLGIQSHPIQSPLRKVLPRHLRDSIENYEEVRELIRRTEFSHLL